MFNKCKFSSENSVQVLTLRRGKYVTELIENKIHEQSH